MTHPGPMSVLGNLRCKRFALFVDRGVVTGVEVSEAPDDPAGGSEEELVKTMVASMLSYAK